MRLPVVRGSIGAALLAIVAYANAAAPEGEFSANYIAIEDVRLSTPNGNARGALKKGELVYASVVGGVGTSDPFDPADVLDVKTEDGRFGLAKSVSFRRLGRTIEVTTAAKAMAEASNRFAFDMYGKAREQKGNLFFSPASVSTALAMTYAGAAGATKTEMAEVLHLPEGVDINEGFSTLLALLNSGGERNGYTLSTANRLWGAATFPFERSFLELTRTKYRAELARLEFGETETARRTINDWAANQTRQKIVDLIPPGILDKDTRLVLTNAIYFEGGWNSVFPKEDTKFAPFHSNGGETIEVSTMSQTEDFPYTEDADAQVLTLPYRGFELSMVMVLPKKREGLAELEGKLNSDRFNGWLQGMKGSRPVEVHLPKFKIQSNFLLSKTLESLGMPTAFRDDANFSRMSTSEALKISEVIHQAYVDVDEKGTEAAAATAVVMLPATAPIDVNEPPKPIVFRADHPFVFAIRENRTGAILFLGRLEQPKAP